MLGKTVIDFVYPMFMVKPRHARLNIDQRNQAIRMLPAGTDVDQVSGAFDVHRTTISRLRDKFSDTDSVKDRPRLGEQRKSTAQNDCSIILRVLRNQKLQHTGNHPKSFNSTRGRVKALMLEEVILVIDFVID